MSNLASARNIASFVVLGTPAEETRAERSGMNMQSGCEDCVAQRCASAGVQAARTSCKWKAFGQSEVRLLLTKYQHEVKMQRNDKRIGRDTKEEEIESSKSILLTCRLQSLQRPLQCVYYCR